MSKIHITPQIRVRLSELERQHGQLTPTVVIVDAKDKNSPLHDLFLWDLKKAALQHWMAQARTIISSVRTHSSETQVVTIDAPYYVRSPIALPREQGYVSIPSLQRDPQMARESLRLEFSRVESALKRARSIASILGLEGEIEDLIARVVRARALAA